MTEYVEIMIKYCIETRKKHLRLCIAGGKVINSHYFVKIRAKWITVYKMCILHANLVLVVVVRPACQPGASCGSKTCMSTWC